MDEVWWLWEGGESGWGEAAGVTMCDRSVVLPRLPGEEPGHAAWRHHPTGALLQEQVHQADLPGRRCHGNVGVLSLGRQGPQKPGLCLGGPLSGFQLSSSGHAVGAVLCCGSRRGWGASKILLSSPLILISGCGWGAKPREGSHETLQSRA